jgi:hypothetical protein
MVYSLTDRSRGNGLYRSRLRLCLVLLLVLAGAASAATPVNVTINATAPVTTGTTVPVTLMTTEPERTGGSIFFETFPAGATIWLDDVLIGTTPFTYYTEKTGTLPVRAWKKGYENSTGTVTAKVNERVMFYTKLTQAPYGSIEGEFVTAVPVSTATTLRRSTLAVPTSWPITPTPSPADPAGVIGAALLATGIFVLRRR